MAHEKNHDYHILLLSIWPFVGVLSGLAMLFGVVMWMQDSGPWLFLIGLAGVLYMMFAWWLDVVAEVHGGDHTPVVWIGLRYGFILFIMSEVMFFVAWFWSFFKHAMYLMYEYVGMEYVQQEFYHVDLFYILLINMLILLLLGCVVTWAYHVLVHGGSRCDVQIGLAIGIGLGVIFIGFQVYEYWYLTVACDWMFGGEVFFVNFFMVMGFHGVHVIIGMIFLAVCWFRVCVGYFTAECYVGFEAAAWYWHFVDVVWLFLFVVVYIWGIGLH